jgi:hypothetical protein
VGGRIVLMKEPVVVFCEDLLADSITDSSGVCELMDCSAKVFMDEFFTFINILCRFVGPWSP